MNKVIATLLLSMVFFSAQSFASGYTGPEDITVKVWVWDGITLDDFSISSKYTDRSGVTYYTGTGTVEKGYTCEHRPNEYTATCELSSGSR